MGNDASLSSIDVALQLFQVITAIWLASETTTPSAAKMWERLAVPGARSYSLYLCHKISLAVLGPTSFDPDSRYILLIQVMLAICVSYMFYLVVERPSHQLSQRMRKYKRGVVSREDAGPA